MESIGARGQLDRLHGFVDNAAERLGYRHGPFSLSVLGTPVKVGSVGRFLLFGLVPARVWGGGPQSGSRWSARSAARTNDLEADEDPPHTGRPGTRQRRCGSSHLLPPVTERVRETSLRVPAPSLTRKSDGEWAGRRHPAEPGHVVLVWVWGHAAASVMTALPSRITMCWPVSACSWVARSRARRCLLIRDS